MTTDLAQEALEALKFLQLAPIYIEIEYGQPGGGYITGSLGNYHVHIRSPGRTYREIPNGDGDPWETLADAVLAYAREERFLARMSAAAD